MAITAQEAWTDRGGDAAVEFPTFVREVVEEVAFQARADQQDRQAIRRQPAAADQRARERRLERRAARAAERRDAVVPRVTDIYAALPSITGKFELEYEGELQGADNVARDSSARGRQRLRRAVRRRRPAAGDRMVRPRRHAPGRRHARRPTMIAAAPAACRACASSPTKRASTGKPPTPVFASAIDFVLEGLYAQKKISRSDELRLSLRRTAAAPSPHGVQTEASFEREIPNLGGRKILQLTSATATCIGDRQTAHRKLNDWKVAVALNYEYRYSKFSRGPRRPRSRGAALEALGSAAVERVRRSRTGLRTTTGGRVRRRAARRDSGSALNGGLLSDETLERLLGKDWQTRKRCGGKDRAAGAADPGEACSTRAS